MASGRQEKATPSHLQHDCLEDTAIQTKISILRDLVASCRGPQGKAKVIQNSSGGHVTWTKCSSRLFQAMSISTPVLKLVISAVQGHLDRFQDGGLLTADFCLSLVETSLKLHMHRRLIIELYERFAVIVDDYLKSDKCACKYDVDVFNLKQVMTVLRSVCYPKMSYLGTDIQEKLCALILDVFLNTIPERPQVFITDQVYVKCFDRADIYESTCLKGILLDCPELSSIKEQTLKLNIMKSDGASKIKVMLVTESMSGDASSFVDAKYEIGPGVDTDRVVVDALHGLCEKLVKSGVGLLLCQRVIHPRLKILVREQGVMFVDRIGSAPIPYIRDLTGAIPLSIMTSQLEENWQGFGWITEASHQILSDKSYLLLKCSDQPIVTLVLKHSLDEVLKDLKTMTQTGLTSLQLLLREPYVLTGGGCWLAHCGAYLLAQVQENKHHLQEENDCSEAQLLQIAHNFVHCLLSVAAGVVMTARPHQVDMKHYHIWADQYHTANAGCRNTESSACSCGLLDRNKINKFEYISETTNTAKGNIVQELCMDCIDGFPSVVDVVSVARNAFKMAVAATNSVLSISQFIHDVN